METYDIDLGGELVISSINVLTSGADAILSGLLYDRDPREGWYAADIPIRNLADGEATRIELEAPILARHLQLIGPELGTIASVTINNQGVSLQPRTVYVTSYGAIGDGVTDDISAFEAAIAACPSGGTVIVPSGAYYLDGSLTIGKSLRILLEDSTVIVTDSIALSADDTTVEGTGDASIEYETGVALIDTGLLQISNGIRANIKGVKLDGKERGCLILAVTGALTTGVIKVTDCTLTNSVVTGSTTFEETSAILIRDIADRLEVTGCDFYNVGGGIQTGGVKRVKIVRNDFETITIFNAIAVQHFSGTDVDAEHILVSHNTAKDLYRMAVEIQIPQTPGTMQTTIVSHNIFGPWATTPGSIQYGISTVNSERLLVEGNILFRGSGTALTGPGIEASDGMTGVGVCEVRNNIVDGFSTSISIYTADRVAVSGNRLWNGYYGLVIGNAAETHELNITDNYFYNQRDIGVWVQHSSGAWSGSFSGNFFLRDIAITGDGSREFACIGFTKPRRPIIISGNEFVNAIPSVTAGFAWYALRANGSTGMEGSVISHNQIINRSGTNNFGVGVLCNAGAPSINGATFIGNNFKNLVNVFSSAPTSLFGGLNNVESVTTPNTPTGFSTVMTTEVGGSNRFNLPVVYQSEGNIINDLDPALLPLLDRGDMLRWKTPSAPEYWNGSSWASYSAPTWAKLTQGKGSESVSLDVTHKKIRLAYDIGDSYCMAPYFVIGQIYQNRAMAVTVEGSDNGSSYSSVFAEQTVGGSGYGQVAFPFDGRTSFGYRYIRFTIDFTISGGETAELSMIQLWTFRAGNQGGIGLTRELPFDWNESGVLKISRGVTPGSGKVLQSDASGYATWQTLASGGVTNGDLHDHIGGDGNPITEGALSLSDNTTADVSISAHGFAPKAPNDSTKFLRGDASWAVPTAAGVGASRVLYANYSNTDQLLESTGNSEQQFATSYTIPANTFTSGKFFRLTLGMHMVCAATAANWTLVVKLGGTTVFTTSAATPATTTNKSIGIMLTMAGTATPGASVPVDTEPMMMYVGSTSFTPGTLAQPVNLATNGTLALTVHVTFAATAANATLNLRQFIFEALN